MSVTQSFQTIFLLFGNFYASLLHSSDSLSSLHSTPFSLLSPTAQFSLFLSRSQKFHPLKTNTKNEASSLHHLKNRTLFLSRSHFLFFTATETPSALTNFVSLSGLCSLHLARQRTHFFAVISPFLDVFTCICLECKATLWFFLKNYTLKSGPSNRSAHSPSKLLGDTKIILKYEHYIIPSFVN